MSIKQNFPTIKPTLNLDFAGSKTVDSRIQFTRASGATYTDALGIIQIVRDNKPRIDYDPTTGECRGLLIEEQRTNLLSNSSDIVANSNWSLNGCLRPIKATVVSPSGMLDAYKIMETSANARHETSFVGFAVGGGNTYIATVYAKAAERNFIELSFGGYPSASFNLTTGAAVANGTQVSGYPKMTAVGNGWYRCEYAWYCASTNSNMSLYMGIEQAAGGYVANQGTSGYGLYIWGAQVELGTFSTSYVPTSSIFASRASSATYFDSTGILRIAPVNGARYGYGYDSVSGKWFQQGLMLEDSATNYLSYSDISKLSNFGVGTGSTDLGLVAGPDGTLSARRLKSNAPSNSYFNTTIPSLPAGTYTFSVWVRLNAGTSSSFLAYSSTYGSGWQMNASPSSTWQRVYGTYTTSSSQTNIALTLPFYDSPANCEIDYAWLQMESGTLPTSYIPTSGAAATRSADTTASSAVTRAQDVATLSTDSSWINQSFTMIGEGYSITGASDVGGAPILAAIDDLTDNNRIQLRRQSAGGSVGSSSSGFVYRVALTTPAGSTYSIDGAVSNTYIPIYWTDSAKHKTAMSIATNSQLFAADGTGTASSSITAPTCPNFKKMTIGWGSGGRPWNGHISKIAFYPKAATIAQLQALTA